MNLFGLSIAEIIAMITILVTFVGGYVRLGAQSNQNTRDAIDALRVARGAREEAQAIRLEVAEKYASVAHLKEVEARLAVAIDRLTDRIDKMLQAINKVQ